MSLINTKQAIENFLNSSEPQILAIKGEWGTGKTHLWKTTVRDTKNIAFSSYAYLSLFGLTDLKQVRHEIYYNTVSSNKAEVVLSVEGAKKQFFKNVGDQISTSFRKSRNVVRLAADTKLPYIKLDGLTDGWINAANCNKVICIDDLERLSESLTVREVLGFLCQLKEDRKCKIAIILNEDAMKDKDYRFFKEKVVDREISFEPTIDEVSQIAFDDDPDIAKLVKQHAIDLGITNLRTLFRIKRLAKELNCFGFDMQGRIKLQTFQALTLFIWADLHHQHDPTKIPSISFIEDYNPSNIPNVFSGMAEEDNVTQSIHKKYDNLLSGIGYTHFDENEVVLLKAVLNGYFNVDELRRSIKLRNRDINKHDLCANQMDAVRKVYSQFDINIEFALNAVYQTSLQALPYSRPYELNPSLQVLRKFSKDDLADSLVSQYFNHTRDNEMINVPKQHFGNTLDKMLYQRCKKELKGPPKAVDNLTVLIAIGQEEVFPQNIENLADSSPDMLVTMIRKLKGDDLNAITKCLDMRLEAGQNKEMLTKLGKNMEEALFIIGKESRHSGIMVSTFDKKIYERIKSVESK
jgi:hypothetical protein